ncbi:MAG: ASKHA domain-containing protein [Thaumarchaeota archaeon]|nr:ASKHA domain-containing protein [Nitrososphaerota archaeon]MCL5318678.1 ASKHA domain-containing protein [Nitrososphaerota archaeon]
MPPRTTRGREEKPLQAEVSFQPEGRRIEVPVGSKIIDAVRLAGIDLQAPCGDLGLCGRCKAVFTKGGDLVEPPTDSEFRLLTSGELGEGYRLTCQCVVSEPGRIVVTVPDESRAGHQRLVVDGYTQEFKVAPVVSKIVVELKAPLLQRISADSDQLLSVLNEMGCKVDMMSLEAMRLLPEIVRQSGWVLTAVLRGKEVLWLEPGDRRERLLGFAVDVGTTKLAGYLVDLKTGVTVETSSLPNPQISYGEDVISRVTYWSESREKAREIQMAVIQGVNRLLKDACLVADVSPSEIYDVTVVGNTAMHHIFFGISPRYTAVSPFPVAVKQSFDVRAKDLGVEANPEAYVHALPPIAGFVGSDTVAGILATGIYRSVETCLFIDIGTNAEMVVGNREQLTCCSSPAGPAFEGRHIKHGMRASTGAIETVWIDPKDYGVGYKTVDDAKPRGICGSGIIDTVAQLFKTGVIGRSGQFNRVGSPRLRNFGGKDAEFVIAWKEETEHGQDITMTSHDVQEVLLAKAAVYSAASILMKRLGLEPNDIQRLYVAGAFGTYVDVTSSLLIGMYPEVPVSRVKFVGNTAGSGARMTLLSEEMRREADKISNETKYLELSSDPLFESEFTKALRLPHREDARFPDVLKMLGH